MLTRLELTHDYLISWVLGTVQDQTGLRLIPSEWNPILWPVYQIVEEGIQEFISDELKALLRTRPISV